MHPPTLTFSPFCFPIASCEPGYCQQVFDFVTNTTLSAFLFLRTMETLPLVETAVKVAATKTMAQKMVVSY